MRKLTLSIILTLCSTSFTPAFAAPIYIFPVAGCAVNYARAHHDLAVIGDDAAGWATAHNDVAAFLPRDLEAEPLQSTNSIRT